MIGSVYIAAVIPPLPAASPDPLGNPVHAGTVRLVPRGGVGAVSVPGSGDHDGDREALRLPALVDSGNVII